MKTTNVVSLGRVRDLLAEVDRMRAAILSGDMEGFYAVVKHRKTPERVYIGGSFKETPQAATRAILRVSAARARTEDEPPLFQVSQF